MWWCLWLPPLPLLACLPAWLLRLPLSFFFTLEAVAQVPPSSLFVLLPGSGGSSSSPTPFNPKGMLPYIVCASTDNISLLQGISSTIPPFLLFTFLCKSEWSLRSVEKYLQSELGPFLWVFLSVQGSGSD